MSAAPQTDAGAWPQSHAEFLGEIFHAVGDGETGCIATVHVSQGKATYPAYPWPSYSAQDFHTHYGVGIHLPVDKAVKPRPKFRRTKETWTGMAVIVLDDIGEEKEGTVIGRPGLEPSFVVETKPGSQQWGYILTEPVRDYEQARLIQTAAVAAGINDPGGQNPARLVRLPGSKPPGKKHAARLVHWTGKRFDVGEVIEGLGLDLKAAKEMKRRTSAPDLMPGDSSPVNISDDPVLAWLDEQGLILGDRGTDGWIEIVCPWHGNHTDAAIDGTGYRPPTSTDPYRSFHCFHRCSDLSHEQGGKNTETFLDWIRESGGPDVGTLDEAAREARKAKFREMRKGTPAGDTDPVLLIHVRNARAAATEAERKPSLNSIIWLLCDAEWGDSEIVRLITHTLRLGGTDIMETAGWVMDQILSARKKQAENARRDAEAAARRKPRPLTKEQRVTRFMKAWYGLTPSEQVGAMQWVEESRT
ncbi:hypothetical protein [Tropicimonas sp. IMCC6043]|uniref:hypothetical protein n=1 Tax=Tropicimonas sp. IMCC6043 TaxID=2510645 RepID=UPI00101C9232|nr:hypothetical protein [Tropicimonas sp. IMCC6043]RYH07783.1 hypothetical protein EU800_18850 [Tropicimonas sp. IMCC6043]